jgi:amino acid permease
MAQPMDRSEALSFLSYCLLTTLLEWATPTALVFCVIILFTAGFTNFTHGNWSTAGFISSYL